MQMQIDSNELRRRINKLNSEMGLINKEEIKKLIEELERESYKQSEFYQMLDKL